MESYQLLELVHNNGLFFTLSTPRTIQLPLSISISLSPIPQSHLLTPNWRVGIVVYTGAVGDITCPILDKTYDSVNDLNTKILQVTKGHSPCCAASSTIPTKKCKKPTELSLFQKFLAGSASRKPPETEDPAGHDHSNLLQDFNHSTLWEKKLACYATTFQERTYHEQSLA